ncbi:SRPBCC domain-containing protein [Herbiconiux sp. CPCC 205763]|uniref:SRPBCC domain-containing protein n=1 Tax=Herbiconiux aconitum TaxID=2970913 RepID=A0ABT2GYF2_9MICO|nr:SRPBCC domain-containing protein [Herbiconiux aconitum]MCS5719986.1 SRPBCC domain-containing protein [Herbiconiux aconitum]
MPVISTDKNTDALSLTFVAEFDADVERIWQLWSDPRQLERWWGPPTWPATFTQHDVVVGGESRYHMTGPEGEKSRGWWRITAVDAPTHLAFDDGFAEENGEPNGDMPVVHGSVSLEDVDGRTRMTTVNQFESVDQMDQLIQMGMDEGMRLAMGQIDELLATARA